VRILRISRGFRRPLSLFFFLCISPSLPSLLSLFDAETWCRNLRPKHSFFRNARLVYTETQESTQFFSKFQWKKLCRQLGLNLGPLSPKESMLAIRPQWTYKINSKKVINNYNGRKWKKERKKEWKKERNIGKHAKLKQIWSFRSCKIRFVAKT
jgi:hypothetical protein